MRTLTKKAITHQQLCEQPKRIVTHGVHLRERITYRGWATTAGAGRLGWSSVGTHLGKGRRMFFLEGSSNDFPGWEAVLDFSRGMSKIFFPEGAKMVKCQFASSQRREKCFSVEKEAGELQILKSRGAKRLPFSYFLTKVLLLLFQINAHQHLLLSTP